MTVAVEVRRRFVHIVLPVLGIGTLIYLGYHFFVGERGLQASLAVEQRLAAAKTEHKALKERRQELEARVAMLREESLDRDMVDERLRQMLNLVRPNDIIILYSKPLERDRPAAQ